MRRAASPPPPEERGQPAHHVGRRPTLKSLFRTRNRALAEEISVLERALDVPTTILILGESGTGKDRLALALHDASNRRDRPFVRVEAANLSDDLFESELFGHERGAFTGAVSGKRGLFEVAVDGTVYLDEISSLSLPGQAKLLRVLQERTFRRLGGTVVHPFRARLVVSSRRDLGTLVREKVFRDDLFYRIDVVSIRLPRLADRPEDVLPLARECLRESARAYGRPARRFSRDAEELLSRHSWPGNVRELFHVVEKATLTADSGVVSAADLPFGALGSTESILATAVERRWTLKQLSDAYIDETLRRAGGNRSLAAKRLGVSRKFLWERARNSAEKDGVRGSGARKIRKEK